MTNISICIGDAFLIDTPPYGEHLYIAIAQTSNNKYLLVNVTTRRRNSEVTCVLLPGAEMPSFIQHESVIAYRFAREMDAGEIERVITPGSPRPKTRFSAKVLRRIQQGALESDELRNRYKTTLKKFLGIP